MIEHALFWFEMNWVERRWKREQNFINGAPLVWQAITTAIDNACESLKEHYSGSAEITCTQQNGHRVHVAVNRKAVPSDIQAYTAKIDVQIIYKADERKIDVIIGYNKPPKSFTITSDEAHTFLLHGGKEISADEFSQLVLEEIVFKVKEEIHQRSGPGMPIPWNG